MFFPLMLLETANSPFTSEDYIFEQKFDGIRAQYSNIEAPLLYSRNKNIISKQFPELLEGLSERVVLDGEIIALDSEGKEDFEGIIKRLFMRNTSKINTIAAAKPAVYHVFDILYYRDKDLRHQPLMDRKKILEDAIAERPSLKRLEFIDGFGEKLFKRVVDDGMEGMVAKKKSSIYVGKRSWYWQKIINWIETEGVIAGYTKKDNALLCQHPDGRALGHILHGMTPVQKEAFFKIASSIKTHEDAQYIYLQPILRCRLKGRGMTSKGALRSGIFVDFIF